MSNKQLFLVMFVSCNRKVLGTPFGIKLEISEDTLVWDLVEKALKVRPQYQNQDVKVFQLLGRPNAMQVTESLLVNMVFGQIDPIDRNLAKSNRQAHVEDCLNKYGPWKIGGIHFLLLLGDPIHNPFDSDGSEKCRKRRRMKEKTSDESEERDKDSDVSRPPSIKPTTPPPDGASTKLEKRPLPANLVHRGFASIDDTIVRRKETVGTLYERLNKYGIVLVRGTPGSGKSTLAELLTWHLVEQEPSNVRIIQMGEWKPQEVTGWLNELTQRGYNQGSGPNCIILWDEAQTTYWDRDLWNGFFKSITGSSQHRVILFVSYGSPSRRWSEGMKAPNIFEDPNCVSLMPIDHGDGLPGVGLLLTSDEYDEFVRRKYPLAQFDAEFLRWANRLTAGHPGAVELFLNRVRDHESYQSSKHSNDIYDTKRFQKGFPRLSFWKNPWGSPFTCGLPEAKDLQDKIGVAKVLRHVLIEKWITNADVTDNETLRVGLQTCFENGWLHAASHVQKDTSPFKYIFASPFHGLFIEQHLEAANPATIEETSLYDFVMAVIRRFSRAALSTRRVIADIQRSPEAQYQDEFYRCCHAHTLNSLVTFPEFGGAHGKIDFYIPSKRWGVEVLRDGNHLDEHNSRFSTSGSYAELPFSAQADSWIILDFRTSTPQKCHPEFKNLYHIVFSADYTAAKVLKALTLETCETFPLLN